MTKVQYASNILILKIRALFGISDFSIRISRQGLPGYTFIELLIVFSIVAIIGGTSIAAFINFGNSQAVDGAASELASVITSARQQTLSQIKPSQCTDTQALQGYRVAINNSINTYSVQALCEGQTVQLTNNSLPSQMSFSPDTPQTVDFKLPNASVAQPAIITVSGYGKTKTINIDRTGAISVQ